MDIALHSLKIPVINGDESFVERVRKKKLPLDDYLKLRGIVKFIGVTDEFKKVVETFPGEGTPAGFKQEFCMDGDGALRVDLVRDISYDKNGALRPTNVLFSADSANPYEIEPISPFIANLTCNPGIVYDLFINNPKANVGGKYKNRDEVMAEIGRILGPGCDISVELNNPFEKDFNLLLEEAEKFREMFTGYRTVIKVPHTGAVDADNVRLLLEGDKRLDKVYYDVNTSDALRGHILALKLHERGFKINFTLMFEPYQTLFALQARPYFINTFVRHRYIQSQGIKKCLDAYKVTEDSSHLERLRQFMYDNDYYGPDGLQTELLKVKEYAEWILRYRRIEEDGSDGLDGMRHNLRVLRGCNLEDTRLIVCSMEGFDNYADIDKLLAEPEFADMNRKVVITAEPNYIARFTSTNQVTSYQRRFMNAAKGMS